jgi:RNA polymerase sigma factor (sigma-70 family)
MKGEAIATWTQGSLHAAYLAHWHELCGYLKRSIGAGPPDPQDVAQTAFLRYAAALDSVVILNPRAFLFRTARNILIDERRRVLTRQQYAREVQASAEHHTFDETGPETLLIERERLRILEGALARMRPRRRAMLLLSRVEGLPCTEIARRAGVSEAAVRKQINLAIRDYSRALESGFPTAGELG